MHQIKIKIMAKGEERDISPTISSVNPLIFFRKAARDLLGFY
jgi:hypothetical protein